MTKVPPLLRRELNAYFASVLGYVALMFFLLVMGVTFAVVVRYLNTGPTQLTAMKILFSMFDSIQLGDEPDTDQPPLDPSKILSFRKELEFRLFSISMQEFLCVFTPL